MNATEQESLRALFSPEEWAWLNKQAIFTCITNYRVAKLTALKLVELTRNPSSVPRDEPLPADLEPPEEELDMALEELNGPDTTMDAQERIARLTRRVAYLTKTVAQAMESAFLDGHNFGDPDANDAVFGVVETRRAELAEAQRQLAALSQRN